MIFASALLLTDFKLTFAGSAWWYALLALAGVALSVLVYRYTLPPVGTARRTILWLLRSLALLLILAMLFEPVISYFYNRTEEATIALLIDGSASMAAESESGSRAAQLTEFLESPAMHRLRNAGRLRAFTFADTVREVPLDSLETLPLTGIGTDPADAWLRAEELLAGDNLAAVVVVSDGIQNLGPNPVRVASESAVPVHTVGVGDTSSLRDAVIAELLTNEITYVGSKLPVDARIRATGLAGKSARVRLLKSDGAQIGEATIRFSEPISDVPVRFEFSAELPGDVRLIAVLDSVEGEQSTKNNRRSVIVRVLESKSRALLLGGAPTADFTYIRQALESDTSLRVDAFLQAGSSYLFGKSEPSEEVIRSADLIVLVDFPSAGSSDRLLNSLRQVCESENTPLLFFAGPDLNSGALNKLGDLLPVSLNTARLAADRVTVRAAASHPLLTGGDYNPAQWLDLPPVQGGAGNFSLKGVAQAIVKMSRESSGVEEDEPAIVVQERAGQRSAAILCWQTFRWRLGMASDPAAGFYESLLQRLVAWSIAPVEEKRVKITTTKKLYSGGETVRFIGEVYGTDLRPRDDAAIDLRVRSGEREDVVPMKSRGNGRYEGDFTPWSDGDYAFAGIAAIEGDTLGSDDGRFAIEAFNLELIDTRARYDLLAQIAEKSGGKFVTAAAPESLLTALNFEPVTITAGREIPLWNKAAMLWIIIILLASEWMLRKRSGML